ncbi:DUF2852 domain-containing protein [Methylobacterium platani]|uniref:DUF2852 domain-containing protein n=2 Tax=Methylobacterium platani TaxID=427683 RepID=A0A179SDU6_9HYPH|nr:DUF2852 domain-containing protein [Methylobacterium platani]KMO20718.1 hypothetical protein SQ03_05085 [Methylobacterium platani JCM 14648]OAS25993.1 hypothetical protein A5481_07475 [Methylobacterium platani]
MPIMPFIHDALYIGGFAGLVLVARQALGRYDLRLSGLPGFERLRRPFERGAAIRERPRFTSVRTSGNTAFDEWRDIEISRIEAQRQALETRLQDFGSFVDKLKRAEDRATFERFMAEHLNETRPAVDIARTADHSDHRPG